MAFYRIVTVLTRTPAARALPLGAAVLAAIAAVAVVAAVGCGTDQPPQTVYDTGSDTGPACAPFEAGAPGREIGPPPDGAPIEDTGPVEAGPETGPKVARTEIDSIFTSSCALSKCHGLKPGAANLYITDKLISDWYPNLINVVSTENPKMKLVVPLDPQKSWMVHKLAGAQCAFTKDCKDNNCGAREPQDSPPLPAQDFIKIVEWIRQGANQE